MEKKIDFSISKSEEEVMNMLWELNRPMSSIDLLAEPWQRTWKDNYLQPMLKSLAEKGLIEVSGVELKGRIYVRKFVPVFTREEFLAKALSAKVGESRLPQVMLEFAKESNAKMDSREIAKAAAYMAKNNKPVNDTLLQSLEAIIKQIKES